MRPDDMLETFSELAVKEPDMMRLVLQASVAALVNVQSVEAGEGEIRRRAVLKEGHSFDGRGAADSGGIRNRNALHFKAHRSPTNLAEQAPRQTALQNNLETHVVKKRNPERIVFFKQPGEVGPG